MSRSCCRKGAAAKKLRELNRIDSVGSAFNIYFAERSPKTNRPTEIMNETQLDNQYPGWRSKLDRFEHNGYKNKIEKF